MAALDYAEAHGKIPADAIGITINCCPDLQSAAQSLCDAVEAMRRPGDPPSMRWSVHVYNGKPRDWWALGFNRRRLYVVPDAATRNSATL